MNHAKMITCCRRRSAERGQGFTLIELLVVVAIIAVLVAILLPALTQARAAAQQMACMANLRQVGLGEQFYAEDHGAWPACYDLQPVANVATWDRSLLPYVGGSTKVFACPTGLTADDASANRFKRSYAQNAYIQGCFANVLHYYRSVWLGPNTVGNARAIDQTQPPWWNVVDVTPERLAMVTEKPVAMLGDQLGASFFYGEFATFPCHGGRGTTYLFADGHVRWMTPAEFVFSPTGSWGLMAIDVSVAVLD